MLITRSRRTAAVAAVAMASMLVAGVPVESAANVNDLRDDLNDTR